MNYLRHFLEVSGVSGNALAKRAGTSRQQVSKLTNSLRKMSKDWAERLAPHFLPEMQVTPQELMFGPGADQKPLPNREPPGLVSSYDPDAQNPEEGDFHPDEHPGVSTDLMYEPDMPGASPVIDTRAGAGPGSISLPAVANSGGVIYSEDAILGEILLPGYLQRELSNAPSGRIHWVRVRGDSMEPTLKAGDHVAVDTTDTSIAQGGMFVARNGDGEIIVKRFFRIPKSDPAMIEVRSDNPMEPTRTVDSDWISIIGRVVAKIARIG